MESHLERILTSQGASAKTDLETNTSLHAKLERTPIAQSTPTDTIVRCTQRVGQESGKAIRLHALETRAQSSSLHSKLDEIGSIRTLQDSLQPLSASRLSISSDLPKTEVERAIQDILDSMYLLLSSLQNLVRVLV